MVPYSLCSVVIDGLECKTRSQLSALHSSTRRSFWEHWVPFLKVMKLCKMSAEILLYTFCLQVFRSAAFSCGVLLRLDRSVLGCLLCHRVMLCHVTSTEDSATMAGVFTAERQLTCFIFLRRDMLMEPVGLGVLPFLVTSGLLWSYYVLFGLYMSLLFSGVFSKQTTRQFSLVALLHGLGHAVRWELRLTCS